MKEGSQIIGTGFYWEDLSVGSCFHTHKRTITETDLVNYVNLTWLTEEVFTNTADRSDMALQGRVVPGAMVYGFSEGLLLAAIQDVGLAFFNAEIDIKGPTHVGDTIHIECEVIETRPTSKSDRGLIRTINRVVNQEDNVVLTYNPLRLVKRRRT